MNKKKRFTVISILVIIAITMCVVITKYEKSSDFFQEFPLFDQVYRTARGKKSAENGTIIFQRVGDMVDGKAEYEYFIMDGDGNHIQFLSYYRGMSAWSPDGDYFAVSCEDDVGKICIVDTHTIPDLRRYPYVGLESFAPEIAKKIQLPNECKALISDNFGLQSISWSRGGEKIAVVCNGKEGRANEKLLCIINQHTGETDCWEDYLYTVNNAYWSPSEDILSISTSEVVENKGSFEQKIFLVGENGENPIFLTEGIAGAWSPDGERIAFTRIDLDENYDSIFSGIGSIDRDGTDLNWHYVNPEREELGPGYGIPIDCGLRGCRLSWSPDGRYIVFEGDYISTYSRAIYRIDLKTGDIVILSEFDYRYSYYSEPDWGIWEREE